MHSMEKVKLVELDEETNNELMGLYSTDTGFVRAGEAGYFLPREYAQQLDAIRGLRVRPDDVWVLGAPRSGTTMTEELVWLLTHALDYTAAAVPLDRRYHYVPTKVMHSDHVSAERASSPRYFKSHLPLSLLPRALLATARVVHVARDPRDAAVSRFHFRNLVKPYNFTGDLKTMWKLFMHDQVYFSPYFENVLESWNERHHPNMMFIFYEDLINDMPKTINRLAFFFGKTYSEEEIEGLCAHLSFDTFKHNAAIHPHLRPGSALAAAGAEPFVRRGKVNAWREYFDEEMTEQAERWIQERLRATDLRFPS